MNPLVRQRLVQFVAGALLLAAAAAAPAQNAAGRFLTAVGEVRVVAPDGTQRTPERGTELREGDTVMTGANALAQVRLADGGLLSIRAETEMKLDRFSHAGAEDRSSSMFISLLKGGLRSVTGLIGQLNRDGYRVTTPTATIGIRGTDHQTFFIPPPAVGAPPPPVQPGTYDVVFSGQTIITGRQGGPGQVVNPNQAGFVSVQGTPPVILPSVPQFLRSVSAPPPPTQQAAPGQAPADAAKAGAPASPASPGERAADDGKSGGGAALRQLSPGVREAVRDAVKSDGATTVAPADRQQLISPIRTAPAATESATRVAPATSAPLLTPIQSAPAVTSPSGMTAPATAVSPGAATIVAPAAAPVSPAVSPALTAPLVSPATPITPTAPLVAPTAPLVAPAAPVMAPTTPIAPAAITAPIHTPVQPAPSAPAPAAAPSVIQQTPGIRMQTAPMVRP